MRKEADSFFIMIRESFIRLWDYSMAAPHAHIHSRSVAGLSYSAATVNKAAKAQQEEKAYYYLLVATQIRMGMYADLNTPLPSDMVAIFGNFETPFKMQDPSRQQQGRTVGRN